MIDFEIVPCGEFALYIDDSKKECIYSCPDEGGQYSHKRARFFGKYKNKKVDFIYEIDCVVVVKEEDGRIEIDEIKYNNKNLSEEEILERSRTYFEKFAERKEELFAWRQLFLLSSGEETNYVKVSPGPLQGKKYVSNDVTAGVKSSRELAEKLKGYEW